jgi:hypothetical protein
VEEDLNKLGIQEWIIKRVGKSLRDYYMPENEEKKHD